MDQAGGTLHEATLFQPAQAATHQPPRFPSRDPRAREAMNRRR
jgi:hypothetical protein